MNQHYILVPFDCCVVVDIFFRLLRLQDPRRSGTVFAGQLQIRCYGLREEEGGVDGQ